MELDFIIPEIDFTDIDISAFTEKNVKVLVARLDKIHPVISGNKLFKLRYFIEEARLLKSKTIITFGGAYSNHLLATAYACKLAGLNSIGIVRGERPGLLSHTLINCENYGMRLHFVPREKYSEKDLPHFKKEIYDTVAQGYIIPEGGYHPLGAMGARHIIDLVRHLNFTHICTAVGSGTTLAGLLQGTEAGQKVIGIPVIKNMSDISERILYLNTGRQTGQPIIFDEYHFGGYAKRTNILTDFMNTCYTQNGMPTDFVYTAKMMYAVLDQLKKNFFPGNSVVICLHTGGLQGNESLPAGTLVF